MTEKDDVRLLEPGWAGELTLEEAKFIQEGIQKDRTLRREWGFKGSAKIPLVRIAEKAFPENPQYGREHIVRERKRVSSPKA